MFWLPLYLQKKNGYSDYETASCVSMMDIGYLIGGVLIGYLTDLLYCRRTPVAVLSIILVTVLHILLAVTDPKVKALFFIHIFFLGILMGGAISIVAGISCTDLVNIYTKMLKGKIKRITKQ